MGGNAVRLDKNPSPARGLKPPGRPRCPLVMKLMKSCPLRRQRECSWNVGGFEERRQRSQATPGNRGVKRRRVVQTDLDRQAHAVRAQIAHFEDRKSTRLNSSHGYISYAVFCLKKKKKAGYATGDKAQVITSDDVEQHL